MATSDRKHTVPAATDTPSRASLLAAFASINDVVPVADVTERSTAATAIAPTASRPLFVWRADAAVGKEIEVTEDGTTWRVVQSHAPNPPAVELTGSGLQAVGTGVWSNVLWPTEVSDLRGMHSTATNTHSVNVPETRWYTITASIYWDSDATGRRGVRINRNSDASTGTTKYEDIRGAVANTRQGISASLLLTAGDFVVVQAFQDSGANRDLSVNQSSFTVAPGAVA